MQASWRRTLEELGLAPIDDVGIAAAGDSSVDEGAALAGGGQESDADSLDEVMGW